VSETTPENGSTGSENQDASLKMAHVWGVSTAEDVRGLPSWKDEKLSPEALAQGFENDPPPPRGLVMATVIVIGLVLVSAVGVAQYFQKTVQDVSLGRDWSQGDPRLAELHASAATYLNGYGKADKGGYQVPVSVAKSILLAHPGLLARHPLAPKPPEPERAAKCVMAADGSLSLAAEGSGLPEGAALMDCPAGFVEGSGDGSGVAAIGSGEGSAQATP